ncbi:MAG: hypothetical protein AB1641_13830 [Thermodesulfobacteriota bacterium]
MHPEQERLFQAMTPERKLELVMDLYRAARELKTAGLRRQYPDWTEEEVQAKVREIFLYART